MSNEIKKLTRLELLYLIHSVWLEELTKTEIEMKYHQRLAIIEKDLTNRTKQMANIKHNHQKARDYLDIVQELIKEELEKAKEAPLANEQKT